MENLTKENFWNEIEKKYPDAMNLFHKWIDRYKEEVDWEIIFNIGTCNYADDGKHDIKFHQIPFEMQNGILARFDIECNIGIFSGKGKAQYHHNRETYVKGFKNLFKAVDEMVKNKSN